MIDSKIIRMCIVCRMRYIQSILMRFQCENKRIVTHTGVGRSFYICKECINSKHLHKSLNRVCKKNFNKEEVIRNLKEIAVNG